MSIDWQHEIDTAVERLPDRAPGDYVAAGQRAVRRRRLVGGVAALTAVVAIGGAGWALSPGDPVTGADAPIASDRSAGDTEGGAPSPSDSAGDEFPFDGLVGYAPGGRLTVRDGAEVVRRVDNPRGVRAPRTSVGLVVEYAGETTWMSLESRPGSGGGTTEKAAHSGWPTFDLWLAADVAFQDRRPGLVLARLDADGTMAPAEEGVEILDQQADPDVPEFDDASATASGVAMLRWQDMTWFVLTALYGDEQTTSTFEAGKAGGAASIEEFLDFARDRYEEGGQ